jgi:hypothetical protein
MLIIMFVFGIIINVHKCHVLKYHIQQIIIHMINVMLILINVLLLKKYKDVKNIH